MEEAIFNIFGKNGENKKPAAVAFVDYEHWYISMYRMYHEKPDIRQWRNDIAQNYDVRDILFFGDFSNQSLRAEIPRIREVSSSIIETQNASVHHKKDYTDFIMLDHIYQRAITYGADTDVFIIFSGDGHFSSVASFLVNRCNKTVVVYGVKDCLSTQLRNTASMAIEWPPGESGTEEKSIQIKPADKTVHARKAEKEKDKFSKLEKTEKAEQKKKDPAKKVEVKEAKKEKKDKEKISESKDKRSDRGRVESSEKDSKRSSAQKSAPSGRKGGDKQSKKSADLSVSDNGSEKDSKRNHEKNSGGRKKDSLSQTIEELDKLTREETVMQDDVFVPYYKEILSNMHFHEKSNTGKTQFKHTYGGTIDAASAYYGRDRDMVSVALDRMCDLGYVTLGRGSGFGKASKTLAVNWDRVKKDKLI